MRITVLIEFFKCINWPHPPDTLDYESQFNVKITAAFPAMFCHFSRCYFERADKFHYFFKFLWL